MNFCVVLSMDKRDANSCTIIPKISALAYMQWHQMNKTGLGKIKIVNFNASAKK